ncbi:hypothetical protein H109_07478 [Trichophyton interdigitale MR816]|uniref:Uncharacterized protein n=1 Tax=Trichophyton interdigitale (strain MR816) TaxID=1215338 RepID=A0A059IYN8_TRIIM|nr:hypothetical protein H101_04492 [Trichophyton interdigitale H6]KDB20573.1 hypothetical protein H109_07478 [Trichophyton interdigitale MR816]
MPEMSDDLPTKVEERVTEDRFNHTAMDLERHFATEGFEDKCDPFCRGIPPFDLHYQLEPCVLHTLIEPRSNQRSLATMKFVSILSACTVLAAVSCPTLAWEILDEEDNVVQEGGKAESIKCFEEIKGTTFKIGDCQQGNFYSGKHCFGSYFAVFPGQSPWPIPEDSVSFRVYC